MKLLQKFTSAVARKFLNMHAVVRLNMPITIVLYIMQNFVPENREGLAAFYTTRRKKLE